MSLDHIDLKEMKRSGDIEGLLCILDTGDTNEVGEAIRMLGELRTRKAIRPLIGLLEKDDIQVRANSAWALGEIGEAKAVLPLIGLLNDPSENVRVFAAWALGKIGDKRAISALNASMKNGSQELRKQAKEAIARIESGKRNRRKGNGDNGRGEEELQYSEVVEIPLVTLDVPMGLFECDYVSKVEGESRKGNTMGFSGDVSIQDTVNANQENTRRIIMGLKNDFHGLVSIDILFKYIDNDGGEKTSSVWLQMESLNNGSPQDIVRELGQIEQIERESKRASRQVFKKARIKPARKQVYKEYEIPDYEQEEEEQSEEHAPSDEPVPEEIPEQKSVKKKESSRKKQASRATEPEIPEYEQALEQPDELQVPGEENPEEPQVAAEPLIQEAKPVAAPQPPVIDKTPAALPVQEVKSMIPPSQAPVIDKTPPVAVVPPVQPINPVAPPQPPAIDKPPVAPPVQAVPPAAPPPAPVIDKPSAAPSPPKTGTGVDSAVRLLSDIGMTGMTEAASTVTQLGGQEAESLQSRLRTLPVDQIPDELVNLGDYVASVDVKLHGKGDSGEMKGEMQMYFPKNVALDIANELLCNGPDAAVKEFTDDIISTLKETANIFGGQYVSAISEYIEIPIYLEAPAFRTGASAQIAESLMKEIAGKVEFVLATDLAFGNGKSGRLIMLLDPKSYDIIITKLF